VGASLDRLQGLDRPVLPADPRLVDRDLGVLESLQGTKGAVVFY
jgi:hypothetical protein